VLRPRITPCLLVQNGGLVKTVGFRSPRYIGDPINAVRIFNEKEADELIVLDIDATAKKREPDLRMIEALAVECRMPLCYGGGIRSREQAKRIIALGVEKVALSTAAVENPMLVSEIAAEVGSQSVVVVLDVRKRGASYNVFVRNGRQAASANLAHLVREFESFGAGELVINSIDRDGEMSGYDLGLAESVRGWTGLPVTVLGGAGSLEDIGALIARCGVVGAAAGSLFVFKGALRGVLINYPHSAKKEELVGKYLR
jgi:imidazole glycerol-phosphate synthase subunit HisF